MKNSETEIAIQLPEVTELVQKSGIELTKAESHVHAFKEKFETLAELSRPLADLNKENPSEEDAAIARKIRMALVKVRTGAETIKDERKAILLTESSLIQGIFNVVKSSCILTEGQYEAVEKHQERIEKERKEKIRDERLSKLEPFEVDVTYLNSVLVDMDDSKFDQLLSDSEMLFNSKKEAVRKAEEEAIAELERHRIAAAEREIENERIRKENESLKKEAEQKEKEIQAEREKLISDQKEESDRLAKIQKEKDDLANTEREKLKAELLAKQKVEDDRIALETRTKEEQEKVKKDALLAPDKEKLKSLAIAFALIEMPELATSEAQLIIENIKILQGKLTAYILDQAGKI